MCQTYDYTQTWIPATQSASDVNNRLLMLMQELPKTRTNYNSLEHPV